MADWYLWFELSAQDKSAATATGLIMASAARGVRLVHVQSVASHTVGQDEQRARQRNRRLQIQDSEEEV